jgi:DNA-binding NtrC family response regulator
MVDKVSELLNRNLPESDCAKAMQNLLDTIEQIARSEFSLLIVGEVGTGKEWTARRIHEMSNRSKGPFVCIDCNELDEEFFDIGISSYEAPTRTSAEMPQSLFERWKGGTVFLNEVSDLPLSARRKLPGLLRPRSVYHDGRRKPVDPDVRFIASGTRRPEEPRTDANSGGEMFYRMSSIIINLPPLRERTEDIPHLIEHFLREFHHPLGTVTRAISPEALRLCLTYDWPGNIQQLKNAIEYSSLINQDGLIQPKDLPVYILSEGSRSSRTLVSQGHTSDPALERPIINIP